MLKLFPSHHLAPAFRVGSNPVKKRSLLLSQLTGGSRSSHKLGLRAFSSDLSNDTANSKANLDDCLSVIALPLLQKPLIPGFYTQIYVKDPKLLAALEESKRGQAPYAGAFLLKEEEGSTDSSTVNILEKLKGKELLEMIHQVGTLAQITSIEGERVVLTGHGRLQITEMVSEDPFTVKIDHLKDKPYEKEGDVIKATYLEVISMLKDVLVLKPSSPRRETSSWRPWRETYSEHIGDFNYQKLNELLQLKGRRSFIHPGAEIFEAINFSYQDLADFGAGVVSGSNKLQSQAVLEELDVHKRLDLTMELVKKKRCILLKAIQKERGEDTDVRKSDRFRERIEANKDKIPKHVLKVMEEQLAKLDSREGFFTFDRICGYLEWLTAMPWGIRSDENFDVLKAEKVLDEDHYGLSDVKERILEFIAVGSLTGDSQGKIICLSGPPGVGKTSVGSSIARALGRKFFRFSLGGLSDVSAIKGHRGVYVGAMPGKMVECLKDVGTENPLVLLDEIDKLGKGHKGDPESALLELLDPQQNSSFLDHYLNVTIDLSKVLFVCTANDIDRIPGPLRDRMEVIHVAGYTPDEKMHIARDYLLKTYQTKCGIKPEEVDVSDAALLSLIENYCRESGVRNLQKQIEKIFRKVALKLVRKRASSAIDTDTEDSKSLAKTILESPEDLESLETSAEGSIVLKAVYLQLANILKTVESALGGCPTEPKSELKRAAAEAVEKVMIDESNLVDYVGKPVFRGDKIYEETPIGVVMGLAWTSMGGSTFYIETSFIEEREGKGGLRITGQLGDVMKESSEIAHTVARRIMLEKEPENLFFANTKLHLHVPKGSTPKDGPSAGCTMITSLLSLAMKKPVRKDLSMTGEVTLTGRILPIGGVKEKTMAARRSQVKVIIFPEANRRDFEELPEGLREGLDAHFVDEYEQIFELAFGYDH